MWHLNHWGRDWWVFKIFLSGWFKGKVRERDKEGERIFHPLVHNGCNSQGWVKPKQGARSSTYAPSATHVASWSIFHCLPGALAESQTGSRATRTGTRAPPIWDASITGLAHCATTPALRLMFLILAVTITGEAFEKKQSWSIHSSYLARG